VAKWQRKRIFIGRRDTRSWSAKRAPGGSSCPSIKIHAARPENAILEFVDEQVLNTDHILKLLVEFEMPWDESSPWRQDELKEKRSRLAKIQQAFDTLLDLVDRFGAAGAGSRLMGREEWKPG
jgi:hypothetical protein